MTESALNRDIALRIALAARELPTVSVSQLLDALQGSVKGGLTEKSLCKIALSDLKAGFEDSAGISLENLKKAVQILRGENDQDGLPEIECNAVPLLKSVRIAMASNEGEQVDGHFGSCARFLIYDVNGEDMRLIDIRSTLDADLDEDRNAARTQLIGDCQVVYIMSVGGPAAAKIIRSGIYPLKQKTVASAREALVKLQAVMNTSPPPWLAKILGAEPQARVRFTASESMG